MKILARQRPTAEQLRIIATDVLGDEVIRGAAGSGKTTTALLRLRNIADFYYSRRVRLGLTRNVKILLLTFNRTLRGYVKELAEQQATERPGVDLEVDTFAKWAIGKLPRITVVSESARARIIGRLGQDAAIRIDKQVLIEEIEYIRGRFADIGVHKYLDAERTGRGLSPRVDRPLREAILVVLSQYQDELRASGQVDWDELPILMSSLSGENYDAIVVDESQDFSAAQLRAVLHHLNGEHTLTLVIDTAQRLYPRGFTWVEIGLQRQRYHRLRQNHRSTIEIAKFAQGLLSGLVIDDDGTLPQLDQAVRNGCKPTVVKGLYSGQLKYCIARLRTIDLTKQSVAFLKPRSGTWFKDLRVALSTAGFPFVEITREDEWPTGPENIALCTMHSAKGLEFDHVFIIGLSQIVLEHGQGEDDDQLHRNRRLLAVAVARARESVILGYKPNEESSVVRYFEAGTFDEVDLV